MKNYLWFALLLLANTLHAQDAKFLLREVNKKFSTVNDYHADVAMKFDIPGVKLNGMSGKVLFKKPNLFKIKAKGIFFLPKQNPMQNLNSMLLDTNAYTSLISGYEMVDGKKCAVVNLIPIQSNDELILGKFWIDVNNPLVLKSQITTKNNGTLETNNIYAEQVKHALPYKVLITFEMNKIKMPKMMAGDLNKKSKPKDLVDAKEKGSIELIFTQYKLNQKISNEDFK